MRCNCAQPHLSLTDFVLTGYSFVLMVTILVVTFSLFINNNRYSFPLKVLTLLFLGGISSDAFFYGPAIEHCLATTIVLSVFMLLTIKSSNLVTNTQKTIFYCLYTSTAAFWAFSVLLIISLFSQN